jgi:hypothetical protein
LVLRRPPFPSIDFHDTIHFAYFLSGHVEVIDVTTLLLLFAAAAPGTYTPLFGLHSYSNNA